MNSAKIARGLDEIAALGSVPEQREEAAGVDFAILGPLRVVGAHGHLDLRGAKRRGLVALLAVHAGEWLSLDRIVDELWGDQTAGGARNTVQTYVSQLRRTFDDIEATIPNRDGCYRLDIPLDSLDSWRFEQRVRQASEVSDHGECLRAVNEALGLWRGLPLEEFDQPWAMRERARLQLLHLQARDVQLDARLALGVDHDVVSELEMLVDEHPLDERFWAKLLLAYYRTGRQADALRAFQRVRSILAQELGIDPGPELVQLEQRILEQDETLLRPRAEISIARRELPTGTVTFLFTDIADSTRLWEQHPDEMRGVIEHHHDLLRAAIERHDGHVVKTIGDGLMAVFTEAPNGAAAAIEGQRTIGGTEWAVPLKVRMGLHSGIAHLIDGDYHAPTVNRAARISSTAHPEQILVSETTASLTDKLAVRDLGDHHLRGLAPIRLYQLLAPGLREDFPPHTSRVASNLPTLPTSFVGRADELAALEALVQEHPLVTVTGSGGCGKTRVATEAARHHAGAFVDGVRFVDLAAVVDENGFDDAVSDGLGLAADLGGTETRTRLVEYVSSREMLVLLDNCEHLLDICADLAETILAKGGGARLLATSREPLGVMGEQVFVLRSLDVETEASTLFADRAKAARADFALDAVSRPTVEQICRRLDGIPLAIELAAARVPHLSPTQILERLDDRFRLLTGGQRRIQRQHTLAATLDWSYGLLDSSEQATLRQLAVFPAAFTLEAAESLVEGTDVLDVLASLVSKSLAQVVDDSETVRYRLLESVRLYAETKLLEAEEAERARSRHRDWVLDWLESMPLEQRWLGDDNVLAHTFPSVRTAIEWSAAQGDPERAARIAGGVDWARSEGWSEGARWCEALQADPAVPADLRARLRLMLWLLDPMRRTQRRWGRAALEATERGEGRDEPLRAVAMAAVARDQIVPAADSGDTSQQATAITNAEQGVAMSQTGPLPWHLFCRFIAGMTHASFRDAETAGSHFAAGCEVDAARPYHGLVQANRAYLAIVRFCLGDMPTALALAQESCVLDPSAPYQHSRPVALVALAAEGDLDTARRALHEYSRAAHASDAPYASGSVAILGGVLAALDEDWETAARLLAAGPMAVYRDPANSLLYFTYRDKARAVLGPARARALRAEGRAMPLDDAVRCALR